MSQQKNNLRIPNKHKFIDFIDSFAKISNSFIIKIEKNDLSVLSTSVDDTLILYGSYKAESDLDTRLNIPDSRRFVRFLESIPDEHIDFKVNANNIEFVGKTTKFKYHLYEDGILQMPGISIDKLNGYNSTHNFDVSFVLGKNIIQNILKNSTLITNTNKIYIQTTEDMLIGDITDREQHNTDNFCMTLANNVDFKLDSICLNLDNIRMISLLSKDIYFDINTGYGILKITIPMEDNKLTYIITSYVQ